MESSRIFVRGLPPRFTDDEFRNHFSKYPVTDAKYFPNRRIGYIGYKSPEEAANAVKYFNKTFIRMSRIYVEIARPISDEQLPKSRRDQKNEKKAPVDYVPSSKDNQLKRKRPEDEAEQDPKLKEFLQVMQPPSKLKSWANEEAQSDMGGASAAKPMETVIVPEAESDDEYQEVVKKPKKASSHDHSGSDVVQSETHTMAAPVVGAGRSGDEEHIPEAPEQKEAEGGPLTDDDWLRSRTKRLLDVEDDEDGGVALPTRSLPQPAAEEAVVRDVEPEPQPDVEMINTADVQEAEPSHEEVSVEDQIRKTSRLYLRNLSYNVTEDDLRQHFSKAGPLEEVHVSIAKGTGAPKGFAFIQFSDPEQAVSAFQENDGIVFQGRLLHILPASAKRENKLDEFEIAKLPIKKQKEIRRKTEAAQATFNWNSLYLNADSVMSSVADRLGISKSELLDPTSSDAAVKQAHAETHIISETKAYFAQHGVDLEAFKRSSKGDVALLVKNIPYGTSQDEVRRVFEEHGTLRRFLMPPSGMTAIIEFSNSTEAKTAFRSLAYRKMKDSILYLEKAPKDLFKEGFKPSLALPTLAPQLAVGKLSATDLLNEPSEAQNGETATLFVRNLNFTTTTDRLRELFSPLDGFQSARVKTKVDPKRGVLSMGFGFLEFKNAEAAAAALKAMDGYNLDGHKLQIRASHKGADAAEERRKEDAAKKAAGTKLSVKNLPFEATKKDLRALFAPYGELRSVRIAKKFDSSSRGFGFAEFTTKREAANALEALRNTHLLGRRLVIEFAETEPDDAEKELAKMQEKVGSQANKVALQRLTGGGRKKFNIAGNDDLDEA